MNFLKNAKRLPVLDWNLTFYGAHEQKVDSSWRVPVEKHYAFECIYILDGTEHVEFKNQNFNLDKGDFCLIPPELSHEVNAVSELKYFCFHFDIDDPTIKIQLIQNIKYKCPSGSRLNNNLTAHLKKLDSLVDQKKFDFSSKMTIQIELSRILQIFYDDSVDSSLLTPSTNLEYSRLIADAIKDKLIDQVYTFVKNDSVPDQDLTIKQAIDTVGLSTGYGSHIFKQAYGISPRKYLSKLKINEAKKLLLKVSFSIEDISLALGYTSVSNFSRQFKRWTNLSPLQYRNQQKGDSPRTF